MAWSIRLGLLSTTVHGEIAKRSDVSVGVGVCVWVWSEHYVPLSKLNGPENSVGQTFDHERFSQNIS